MANLTFDLAAKPPMAKAPKIKTKSVVRLSI